MTHFFFTSSSALPSWFWHPVNLRCIDIIAQETKSFRHSSYRRQLAKLWDYADCRKVHHPRRRYEVARERGNRGKRKGQIIKSGNRRSFRIVAKSKSGKMIFELSFLFSHPPHLLSATTLSKFPGGGRDPNFSIIILLLFGGENERSHDQKNINSMWPEFPEGPQFTWYPCLPDHMVRCNCDAMTIKHDPSPLPSPPLLPLQSQWVANGRLKSPRLIPFMQVLLSPITLQEMLN